jgi:hypothetical protein
MSCARAKINLTACEGATFDQSFVWKTGEEEAEVDLTGYAGTCHIRERINSDEIILTLANDIGVVIKDQETDTGGYQLYIAPDDLAGICPNHQKRTLVYDLRLTAPDGTIRLQQYGNFNIEPAVTRPWEL